MSQTIVFILDSLVLIMGIRISEFIRWQVKERGFVRGHTKILTPLREFNQQWRLRTKYCMVFREELNTSLN